jgi:hypothetical protein
VTIFTAEGEAKDQISASPDTNVGFGERVGVTAKSSCCLLCALFNAPGRAEYLSHFEALGRDIVAVDFENRGTAV